MMAVMMHLVRSAMDAPGSREDASFNFPVTDDQKVGYTWTGTEHKVTSLFSFVIISP